MASIIDLIFDYFRYFLPSLTVAAITVVIGLSVYIWGKRVNIALMDDLFTKLEKEMSEGAANIDLAETSTNGRTYLIDLNEELLLENFRIHFALVPRHLIISLVGAKLRKRKDYLLIEADPLDKIVKRYQLEIFPKREEKRIKKLFEMLGQLEPIRIGGSQLGDIFGIWANNAEFFKGAFQKEPEILRNIFAQKDNIVRLSYYPLESPSIRLVLEITDTLNPGRCVDILFGLTSAIVSLGTKGFYTKQKKHLRVIKDETIEEEKQRGIDKRYRI
ncbi:MAG: hypothetical protein ACXAB2_01280 [Candidatus Hodarchaeales archaeon]